VTPVCLQVKTSSILVVAATNHRSKSMKDDHGAPTAPEGTTRTYEEAMAEIADAARRHGIGRAMIEVHAAGCDWQGGEGECTCTPEKFEIAAEPEGGRS
jgi:hypothetical protein